MITITRILPERMIEAHRRTDTAAPAAPRRPRIANVRAVRELDLPAPLYFRGRRIPVRPVPFEEGLRLLELAARIDELVDERSEGRPWIAEYRRAVGEAMDICWSLAGPAWLPRWVQRLRRNPFRRASLEEVRDILGFFGRCQTISLVGHRSSTDRRLLPT